MNIDFIPVIRSNRRRLISGFAAAIGLLVGGSASFLVGGGSFDPGFVVVQAVALTAILAILFHRRRLAPVRELTEIIEAARRSGTRPEVPDLLARRRDAPGDLCRAIDGFLTDQAGRTEVEIEKSIDQLRTAVMNMSQGLCMFDPDTRLILQNPRAEEIYGLEPGATCLGMTISEIIRVRHAAGAHPGESIDDVAARRKQMVAVGGEHRFVDHLSGGRVISVWLAALKTGGWIATYEDTTEHRRYEEQMLHMANHDALTGLPNRARFRAHLEQATAIASATRQKAIFCLDLDHFKLVNDTLGHPVGDLLLRAVAERLTSSLRKTDLVARLGGDEFAVVIHEFESIEDLATLAQRIVRNLSAPYILRNQTILIGVSVGIAIAPKDGTDPDRLVIAADLALYEAKSRGRGTHVFFEREMDRRARKRRKLELELREALNSGQFELHYQPIIDLRTNRPVGMEAIVLWHHPRYGLLPPERFIPLAEENGLICEIGAWVLHKACEDTKAWPDDMRVAVSLSGLQVRNDALIRTVQDALDHAGLAPHRLELEVTETVLMKDMETAVSILTRLGGIGIGIALDDFGTGFLSLGHLQRIRFIKIKFDRSLLKDLHPGSPSLAIVQAVISLGRTLGMQICVEGVETREQAERIIQEGCDQAQGFLYSHAVPATEVPAVIDSLTSRSNRAA